MQQAKFSLSQSLVEFLAKHRTFGFKDKSAMVRAALDELKKDLELQELKQSADLYAELYDKDPALQETTDSAITRWPE